jgi:hypothetical protein
MSAKSAIVAGAIVALWMLSCNDVFAQATASTTTARNPDGTSRITIQVKRGTPPAAIKDVHLCVAKTSHSPAGEKTDSGDPINSHYSNPAGAPAPAPPPPPAAAPTPGLPVGWTYQGVVEDQASGRWCVTWINPAAALGADFDFVVDYSGETGEVGKPTVKNLFLTSGGTKTWAPEEVLNGTTEKKVKTGEIGHVPGKPK